MWFRKKADRELLELVSKVLDRQEKLERDMRALELDWENTYDKLKTMMQRVAKRHEAVVRLEEQHTERAATAIDTSGGPSNGSGGRLLTPRQLEVQQQVLRRRGGGGS